MSRLNPMTAQEIAANRLGLALCIALAAHALLLGISFSSPKPAARNQGLEVTLAYTRAEQPPQQADYLAQVNQLGSGQLDHKAKLSTTQQAERSDAVIRQAVKPQLAASEEAHQARRNEIKTTARSSRKASEKALRPEQTEQSQSNGSDRQTQLDQEIASLEAELDRTRQEAAREPRTHRITSVSTREREDAAYLYSWQTRIEKVGNERYPEEASRQALNADLRMLVALKPNGTIAEIKILESSGHPALDNAAVRIVRIAAPFDPFTRPMRQKYDRLEIIRTWQFRQNHFSGS